MIVKDNFSAIANDYLIWRPNYPAKLFSFIASLCNEKKCALDCGTGNGQAAKLLAANFNKVYAIDISQSQLKNAIALPNIFYSISTAEKTNFANQYFDLVCAAQAAHWFNHKLFYAEIDRIIKPNGIIALIGYGLINVADNEVNKQIQYLYKTILGNYWDHERKFIDSNYQSLTFPYKEIPAPSFEIICNWDFKQLVGYLNTWSALNHYKKINGKNILQDIIPNLQKLWGVATIQKTIKFKLFLKIGKMHI